MFARAETMTIPEYFARQEREPIKREWVKKAGIATSIPVVIMGRSLANANPVHAQANVSDEVKQKILTAFDPLIDLMISLSYPVAGVMITGGALMIMVGARDKGYSLLQSAGIGYVLVQMSPLFLRLLAGVGEAI